MKFTSEMNKARVFLKSTRLVPHGNTTQVDTRFPHPAPPFFIEAIHFKP